MSQAPKSCSQSLLEEVANRVSKQLERSSCSCFEERPGWQQLSDLSWRDCDCQEWTPATWSVETGDCTRSPEGARWPDESSGNHASRDWQHTILKRPIQLLYPLEIHCKTTATIPSPAPREPKPREALPAEDDVTERVRPKRAAARKADEVRREWIAELEKGNWEPAETIDW